LRGDQRHYLKRALDGRLILEIKAPYKSCDSELWKSVSAGISPEHYRWQIETQLMVSGAEVAHLYVIDGKEVILVEQRPAKVEWDRIHDAWEGFMRFFAEDLPPPLTDREWELAAEGFFRLKAEAEAATAKVDEAKAQLVELAKHPSEKGAGVSVSRCWKAGNVDYKKVPELPGVELEKFRGPAREEVRVTIVKQ